MPNSNQNPFFVADEAREDEENLPGLGYQEDDGKEEEKDLLSEDEENESPISTAEDKEDFDLDEDVDMEISGPAFISPQLSSLLNQDDDSDEEEGGEDEEEVELADDESASAEDAEDENEEDGDGAEEESIEEDEDDEESFEDEDGDSNDGETVVSKSKIVLARKFLNNIQENTEQLSALLGGLLDDGDEERIGFAAIEEVLSNEDTSGGRIVEGVFNGENMIGPDGHEYAVPANYASKSKLVEGDMLKLTITGNGIFRYKQTKPVDRNRIIGKLEKDQNGNYFVNADKKKYRVITASITYYKGLPGDKVVILVPVGNDSAWAAVENVIKSK
jgi:hypothetical protein